MIGMEAVRRVRRWSSSGSTITSKFTCGAGRLSARDRGRISQRHDLGACDSSIDTYLETTSLISMRIVFIVASSIPERSCARTTFSRLTAVTLADLLQSNEACGGREAGDRPLAREGGACARAAG